MKFANNGKVMVCGEWTSEMKTHFYVSVAICSDKDIFDKKLGKVITRKRHMWRNSIVVTARQDRWGYTPKLKKQLQFFLENNF